MNPACRRRGKEPGRGWIRSRGVGATPLHDLHEVACVSAQLQSPTNQTMRRPAPSPIDAARFRPRPWSRLVLRPTSNPTPPSHSSPWDKLRASSSSAACPGAHHLLRPVLALPRFLGRGGQIDTRRGLVFRELVEPTRHMAPCFVCRRRPRGPVFRDLDARSGNARTDCGVGPGWLGRLGLASERGERTTGPPGSCARVLSRRGLIRFASFRQTRGLVGLVALRCVARLDGGNLDVIARRQPKSRVPFPPSDAFPTRAKPP